ncbi:protein-L-isoaspartate O-methyltransferase family protein [Telmatospirillum siberiense]|uniref:protein-L-isoaspartate O-methyltransferase family protein n=1 Tax=Telmatospirillum siberiense TaxID=382514 RepID=UPI001F5369B4|nr:protein-L-isoaspartate O-methyltransferase [Telmatospirillum siberiense]
MNYAAARHNMVENQIRTNRITNNAVIDALGKVPREAFVPKQLRGVAYLDEDIDLAGGRYLMEPLVFAAMLQAADINPDDVVLDVGCGTGYSAAVLARLSSTVVALESDGEMVVRAGALLAGLSVDNVAVVGGSLTEGDPAHGPYQVIVIEGAVPRIPDRLLRQLTGGGRLVAVLADETGLGRVTVTTRVGEVFSSRVIVDASVRPLPEFHRKAEFIF